MLLTVNLDCYSAFKLCPFCSGSSFVWGVLWKEHFALQHDLISDYLNSLSFCSPFQSDILVRETHMGVFFYHFIILFFCEVLNSLLFIFKFPHSSCFFFPLLETLQRRERTANPMSELQLNHKDIKLVASRDKKRKNKFLHNILSSRWVDCERWLRVDWVAKSDSPRFTRYVC